MGFTFLFLNLLALLKVLLVFCGVIESIQFLNLLFPKPLLVV